MDQLTTLARRLEPFIRKMIREMIGEMKSGSTALDNLTYIHGTGFPQDDKTGNRGTWAVDLQLQRSYDTEVASGDLSTILGGYENKITTDGDYSAAMGGGAIVDTPNRFTNSQYGFEPGDSPVVLVSSNR